MRDEGRITQADWDLYHRESSGSGEGQRIEVMCPRCRKVREMVITPFWSGRGTPRKYCERCKWLAEQIEPGWAEGQAPNDNIKIAARMAKGEAPACVRGRPWSVSKYV